MGMAENYKPLYEQMKKIVTTYQDEVVPGLREIIKDLEQNQIKVRCKDCVHMKKQFNGRFCDVWCLHNGDGDEGFCNYGERRTDG